MRDRILLTGATGLIGKEALAPLLSRGFEVYAVSSKTMSAPAGVKPVRVNLLNADEIRKVFSEIRPQFLLHFAWVARDDYLTSPLNRAWLESGMLMLQEFHKNGGQKAVYAGTCFEYSLGKSAPLNENDPLEPATLYASCKNDLRERAERYAVSNGLAFGWGRIFYVFGHNEFERRLVPYVIKKLMAGEKVVINSGNLIRDYWYAGNIAAAFAAFLDSAVTGSVNICSGRGITLKELVTLIAARINRTELLEFHTDEQSPPYIVGNDTVLRHQIGFAAPYDLEAALTALLDDFSQQKPEK